jgi:hypothetical protein
MSESYTKKSLAYECGIHPRTLQRHINAGVLRIDKAAKRIPGVGIVINGALAAPYISAMKAKTKPTN